MDLSEMLPARATELRRAYFTKNADEVRGASRALVRTVTDAYATQDSDLLRKTVACLGGVIQAADAFGEPKPSEHWRVLSDVAAHLAEHPQRLEIASWFKPNTVRGRIYAAVKRSPGITHSAIADALGLKAPHVSNEVSKLVRAGLLLSAPNGRERNLFLSDTGPQRVDQLMRDLAETTKHYEALLRPNQISELCGHLFALLNKLRSQEKAELEPVQQQASFLPRQAIRHERRRHMQFDALKARRNDDGAYLHLAANVMSSSYFNDGISNARRHSGHRLAKDRGAEMEPEMAMVEPS